MLVTGTEPARGTEKDEERRRSRSDRPVSGAGGEKGDTPTPGERERNLWLLGAGGSGTELLLDP